MKSLIFVSALFFADGPSARQWADGLGSPSPEIRYATIDAIDEYGTKGLPILREIAVTASGETRSRAFELIERIGTRRLLRPTLVSLNVSDQPLLDATKTLSDASGFPMEFEQGFDVKGRKVAAHADGPIPFYESLDRLGSAGGFRHDLSTSLGSANKGEVRVQLTASTNSPPPTSYAGPYKVVLRALERHREVVQSSEPTNSAVREEFFAIFDVVAEPGILIDRNGGVRVREALDDRGLDLRSSSSMDTTATSMNPRAWAMAEIGQFSYRLSLNLPEGHGTKIARLRGYVPITAIARTDEIFSSPVAELEGKSFQSAGLRVRFNRVALSGKAGYFEITVGGESAPNGLALSQVFAPGPRQTSLATLRQGFGPDDHLRIEDDQGNVFGCHANPTSQMSPDGSMNYRVTIFANQAGGTPTKIRYFGVAGVATEVPFEFRELEIP